MTLLACFTALLWYGLLTLRAPGRWWLTGFEIGLFALAAILIVRRRFAVCLHPIGFLLGVGAVWALAQVALGISVDPQRTLDSALGWTVNCAAFSVALAVTGSPRRRESFLTTQLLFALVLSVTAVIWLFTAHELGPFAYRNQFAAYVESVLGIAILAAIRQRSRSLIWMLIAAALFAAVVAGASRAGSVLCLAELAVLPAVAFAGGWIPARSLARVAALAVITGAALVAVVGWQTIWHRMEEPNPYGLRENLLLSSIRMTRDRPLAGFGLGAWSSAYPAYARYDDGTFVNQAHNDWAQWAAEGGIPFLLLMAAIVALLARPAFDSLWGLGLMAVFVHAWVDYPFEQRPALAAFFFAMAGVLAASRCAGAAERRAGPRP